MGSYGNYFLKEGGIRMKHLKGVSLFMILLMMLHLLPSQESISVNAVTEDGFDVSLSYVDHTESSVEWLLAIDVAEDEADGLSGEFRMSEGLLHGAVIHDEDMNLAETEDGYRIEAAEANGTYEVQFVTELLDTEAGAYQVEAEVQVGEVAKKDIASVEVTEEATDETGNEEEETGTEPEETEEPEEDKDAE